MSFAFSVNFSNAQVTGVDGVGDRAEYDLHSTKHSDYNKNAYRCKLYWQADCKGFMEPKQTKHHENVIEKKYGKLGNFF